MSVPNYSPIILLVFIGEAALSNKLGISNILKPTKYAKNHERV